MTNDDLARTLSSSGSLADIVRSNPGLFRISTGSDGKDSFLVVSDPYKLSPTLQRALMDRLARDLGMSAIDRAFVRADATWVPLAKGVFELSFSAADFLSKRPDLQEKYNLHVGDDPIEQARFAIGMGLKVLLLPFLVTGLLLWFLILISIPAWPISWWEKLINYLFFFVIPAFFIVLRRVRKSRRF